MRVYKITVDKSAKKLVNVTDGYIGVDLDGEEYDLDASINPKDDCGELVFKYVKADDIPDNGRWVGPEGLSQKYGTLDKPNAIEISAYYKGKLAGRVYDGDPRVNVAWLDVHLDQQRLVNTFQQNEILLRLSDDEEMLLYKFSIDDHTITPIGLQANYDTYDAMFDSPVFIDVISNSENDENSIGDVVIYINGLLRYERRAEFTQLLANVKSDELTHMKAGYGIGAFYSYCERRGFDPKTVLTEAYNNFYKINPELDVKKLTTIDTLFSSCMDLRGDKVNSWAEDAKIRLGVSQEQLIDEYKSKYKDGMRMTISFFPWRYPSYRISEFRENEPEQVTAYCIDRPTAEEIMKALPSCGYVKCESRRPSDYELTVLGVKNGETFLLEKVSGVDDPEKYAVAPALTVSTLEMMGIEKLDNKTINEAKDFYNSIEKKIPEGWEIKGNEIKQPIIFVDERPLNKAKNESLEKSR